MASFHVAKQHVQYKLITIWLRVWLMILGLAAYLLMSANGAIGTRLKIK